MMLCEPALCCLTVLGMARCAITRMSEPSTRSVRTAAREAEGRSGLERPDYLLIAATWKDGLLPLTPVHYVTKHLQQGIESGHLRVNKNMPRIGGFQLFHNKGSCA